MIKTAKPQPFGRPCPALLPSTLLLSTVGLLSLNACMIGTDTGNAGQDDDQSPELGELSLALTIDSAAQSPTSERPTTLSARVGSALLEVERAHLSVTQVEVSLTEARCDVIDERTLSALEAQGWRCEAGQLSLQDELTLDLMSGESAPYVVSLPAGSYREVTLSASPLAASPLSEGSEGSPLVGPLIINETLKLTGQLTHQNDHEEAPRPFELSLSFSAPLSFKERGGFQLQAMERLQLLLNLTRWVSHAKLTSCLQRAPTNLAEGEVWSINANSEGCEGLDEALAEGLQGAALSPRVE